jgi:hypothetical protein
VQENPLLAIGAHLFLGVLGTAIRMEGLLDLQAAIGRKGMLHREEPLDEKVAPQHAPPYRDPAYSLWLSL